MICEGGMICSRHRCKNDETYTNAIFIIRASLGNRMTMGLKFAIVVTAVTTLIISGILVSAANIPCTALGSSSSSGGNPTSSLAFDRSYEGHKHDQFASSIKANKYG
jgi:hypothetical protein